MSTTTESDDESMGDAPTATDTGSFTWTSCEDCDDKKRVAIKENAVAVGISQCKKLMKMFETSVPGSDGLNRPDILGREALQKWVGGCEDLIRRHRDFGVLVGVAGPTGSGKTSTLNALLGFNELLPTSNQEAATAVACKIAYNYDMRTNYKFRATVTFRTKMDLTKQLDLFFEDMRGRDELRKTGTSSAEDYEALRNANANLKPTFEMIRTVFGLGEKDLVSMTTKDLLGSKTDVGKLLGKTKSYHGGDVDELSENIKPYMDSTTAKHTKSGQEFAAWPLVDKVELFVRSEILRNGVVLVDLPGLADSVESRAAVAERYFSKLAATLIVSPARRAADDSTSVKLMEDHQELRMKLDGRFHHRSYCVAVSMIDHIDRASAMRSRDVKSNSVLQRLIEEEKVLKSKKKDKEGQLKAGKKELAGIGSKTKQSGTTPRGVSKGKYSVAKHKRQRKSQLATIAKLKREVDDLEGNLKALDGHITFLCVKARNEFLEDRIQHDFEQRQAQIAVNDDGLKATYNGRVSICPISAKAFWPCVLDEERLAGFPDSRYSGIPNLTRWIRNATLPEREDHANTVLHDLNNCFSMIQTWSRKEWGQNRLHASSSWIEAHVFPSTYTTLEESLGKCWKTLNSRAKKCNPLLDRKDSLENCQNECLEVVNSWSYKNTQDDTEAAKIHWLTYQANIQRKGLKFLSNTTDQGCLQYSWMEDLANVLLKTLVGDWNQALNIDIPELATGTHEAIDMLWASFTKRLQISVEETLPELLPFLEDVIPSLDLVKEGVKDEVRQALKDISKGASEVHQDLVKEIQKKWVPTFRASLKEKGKHSLRKRQDTIAAFAQKSGRKMFNAAFDNMRAQLKSNFDRLPNTLENISKVAVQKVKGHISMLLNNALLPETKVEEEEEAKLKLQHDVRNALLQWDLEWKVPEADCDADAGENTESVAIPKEYVCKVDLDEETADDEYEKSDDDDNNNEEDGDGDDDDDDSDTEDGSYIGDD